MQLLPNYALLEVLSEEEPCTFRARQISSGRTVLLHRFSGGGTHVDQIGLIRMVVRYLRKASTTRRSLVLDMVEHQGAMYLVTEVIPEFHTLKQWLESEMKGQEEAQAGSSEEQPGGISFPAPAAKTVESPRHPPEGELHPGSEAAADLTRIFRVPKLGSPPPQPSDVAQFSSRSTPASQERGQFTEIVEPSPIERSSPLPAEVPEAPSGRPLASPEPGEFTRIFQPTKVDRPGSLQAEIPEAISDTPGPSAEAGEFTRMFQGPLAAKPRPLLDQVPDRMSDRAQSSTAPGEFTAMFESPADSDRPIAPAIRPSESKEAGDFTRIFGTTRPEEQSSEGMTGSRRPADSFVQPRPSAPLPLDQDKSTSRPQAAAESKPQDLLPRLTPNVPAGGVPGTPEKPPVPARPALSSMSLPKRADAPSLGAPPSQPPIGQARQSAPPPQPATVQVPQPAAKLPQPPPPKLSQQTLPELQKRASYLPLILILGGLLLAVAALILFVVKH